MDPAAILDPMMGTDVLAGVPCAAVDALAALALAAMLLLAARAALLLTRGR